MGWGCIRTFYPHDDYMEKVWLDTGLDPTEPTTLDVEAALEAKGRGAWGQAKGGHLPFEVTQADIEEAEANRADAWDDFYEEFHQHWDPWSDGPISVAVKRQFRGIIDVGVRGLHCWTPHLSVFDVRGGIRYYRLTVNGLILAQAFNNHDEDELVPQSLDLPWMRTP